MSNLRICTYEKDQDFCPTYQRERFDKSTSDKYQQVSTRDIMQRFFDRGFELQGISANKVRNKEKRGYQKHVSILSHSDFRIDDNTRIDLLIQNAHDGSSSVRFNLGAYEFVCANGLVVGDTFFDYRVRHSGKDFIERIDFGIDETLRVMPMVAQMIRNMKQFNLTQEQVNKFCLDAANLRLKNVNGVTDINLASVGFVRHKEQQEDTLYNVFNRAQESVIRGGIQYRQKTIKWNGTDGKVIVKNKSTRAVKAIGTNMELNKELWNMATQLMTPAA